MLRSDGDVVADASSKGDTESAKDRLLRRPVIVHRAILGSVERFMAILTENFGGKYWLHLSNLSHLYVLVVNWLYPAYRRVSLFIQICSLSGKWPFWINPRQALVIPVKSSVNEYAKQLVTQLHDAHFMVNIDDDPGRTLNKKIRNGQLAQYNFLLGNCPSHITFILLFIYFQAMPQSFNFIF